MQKTRKNLPAKTTGEGETMNKKEREEHIIKMMVLTQKLNEWTLNMSLKLIQEKSKQVKP